ncbi:lipopolysaccharide biosynthesis protein [Woodsholea maritima]|uniref:lipopolysaccharide biosynthesis protein n=1 Tax=Woodsholea maritima TaxID=240237 RepID=UPI00036A3A03|nr:lipopolysaccharide biosynthesis protein [Woodsholea maritima]
MLKRHLLYYLPVQLSSAIVGFGSVVIFTRLLGASDYGRYSLVLAGVNLIQMALFTWLDASVARYHVRAQRHGRVGGHWASLLKVFFGLAGIIWAAGSALLWLLPLSHDLTLLLHIALTSLCLSAFVQISQQARRASGEAGAYAIRETAFLLGGFMLGLLLMVTTPLGPAGPFAGTAIAGLLMCLLDGPTRIRAAKSDRADGLRLKTYMAYGLPISLSLMFEQLLSTGDRFVIASVLGEAATGAYAAGYGLTDRTINLVFIWLGAAAGPLMIKTLEREGRAAAQAVAKDSASLMVLLGFPAALGLGLVAKPLASLLIAPELALRAAEIMPWIALGGLLNGLMTYFFHEAFILGKKPKIMAYLMIGAAIFNLIANMVLVPVMGLVGAALATVLAYGLGLVICALVGHRIFPLPLPWADIAKAGMASLAMAASLYALPPLEGLIALILPVALGGLVYGALALILNIAQCRDWMAPLMRRLSLKEAL